MLATMILLINDESIRDRASDILALDKVGSGMYTEAIAKNHIETLNEKGVGYLDFLEKIRSEPATAPMYSFLLVAGPSAVYGLIETMGGAGLLDKKLLTKSAGISASSAPAEKPWFRSVLDEIAPIGYSSMDEHFKKNLGDYRSKYPSIPADVANLKDLLIHCKKSTLFSAVDGLDINVKQKDGSNKSVTTALGFRIDAHSAARNGGFDPETGEFVEKKDKKEEKEESASSK